MTLINEERRDLISEVVSKSNLKREQVAELIREKRAKVGGGYLTEQGALFLVASDLGIKIDYDRETYSSLSQLTDDLKAVTVIARIMSVGLPKVFTRRSDSRTGLVVHVVVYDNNTTSSISLWDSVASNFLKGSLDIRPGDMVKISNAYTRPGVNGAPVLNLGERGTIEKVLDENTLKIDPLNQIALSPSTVTENASQSLVIKGRIIGDVRRSNFTRSDGSASEYSSFAVTDESNSSGRQTRVVIWGNPEPTWNAIHDGDIVTLLSVRTKLSTFQNSSTLELHGEDSSAILEKFDERRKWISEQIASLGFRSSIVPEEKKREQSAAVFPFVARIAAIRRSDASGEKVHLLVLDSQNRRISITVSGDSVLDLQRLSIDDVVLCRAESFDLASLRANCSKQNSISKVSPKRPDIPNAATLFKKVEELQDGVIISLEAMCLSEPVNREIQTKEGLVKRAEMTVADHTGEIKIYGWRNLSKALEGFSAGDRITVEAVEVQSFEGKKFLLLKNYSSVEKKSSPEPDAQAPKR